MNAPQSTAAGKPTLDAYLSAIRETFGAEPWDDIAPFAERVWVECRFDGDPEWDIIRERIRSAWSNGGP